MILQPRHINVVGALIVAGALATALMTGALQERRIGELRRQLAALDTMTLEPVRKASIRSNLTYHLGGVEQAHAQLYTARAPFLPMLIAGALLLTVGTALTVIHSRARRASRDSGAA